MRTDWLLLVNGHNGKNTVNEGAAAMAASPSIAKVTAGEISIYFPYAKLKPFTENNDNNGNHTRWSDPV